jgi:RNA polymerase sigma factor (sigma-70 family)
LKRTLKQRLVSLAFVQIKTTLEGAKIMSSKSNSIERSEETLRQFEIFKNSPSEAARRDAAEKIMEGNDALVMSILQRFFPTYINNSSMQDMLQEGRLGMYEALLTWKPEKGMFSTHAAFAIKHKMYEFASASSNLTPYYQSQIKKFNQAVDKLAARGITNPSANDIADEMKVGIEAVQRIAEMMKRNFSSMEEREESGSYAEDSHISPIDMVIEKDEKEALYKALTLLDQKQTMVIKELFFYEQNGSDKPDTLVNIGRTLGGLSADEIKKIRAGAIKTLERALKKAGYGNSSKEPYSEYAEAIPLNFAPHGQIVQSEINVITF